MRAAALLFAAAPRAALSLVCTEPQSFPRALPQCTVDLDREPEGRWVDCAETAVALHGWEGSYGARYAHLNATLPRFGGLLPRLTAVLRARFPTEYRELEGLRAHFAGLGHAVPMPVLVLEVYANDLGYLPRTGLGAYGCSSVVVQDRDGGVLHGRNYDYSTHVIRNLTLQASWVRGGRTVAVSAQEGSRIGFITAMAPGVASLSDNDRECCHDAVTEASLLGALDAPGSGPKYLLARGAILGAADYTAALATLSTCSVLSPQLWTVAGAAAGEGAVVARGPATSRVARIGGESWNAGDWHVFIANTDWWASTPANDFRGHQLLRNATALGRDTVATERGLFGLLSEPADPHGVFNPTTMFTVVMSPRRRSFTAHFRSCE